ncbi:hypothetical protein HYX58_00215 [Candidatus Dependentiae bacterium]|nr:hypothetical protein [Candidatus Dependentiae bacterium]
MHLFKKLTFLVFIALSNGVALSEADNESNQDLIVIFNVLGKAVEAEINQIDSQITKENRDFASINRIIKQKLPTIKTKSVHAFQHDLTQNQRTKLVNILQDLRDLSVTTADDLMIMAKVSTEDREAMNESLKKRYPNGIGSYFSQGQAGIRKFEKEVDLGNPSFNMITRFMCKCGYLDELSELRRIEIENAAWQRCYEYAMNAIALPFVAFNDLYFFPGWQQEFQKSGNTFAIMNTVCTALLEAVDQK